MKVLSTKILSNDLKARLKEEQITVIEHNFIAVSFLESARAKNFVSVNRSMPIVFTSQNGYTAYRRMAFDNAHPVYCMSGATRQLVEREGLSVLKTGKDSAELAGAICKDSPKEVIYFSGNLRSEYLPQKLKQAGIVVHEFIVYETKLTPAKVEEGYHAVLFFSPSAVRSFYMENTLQEDVSAYGIGPTTIKELEKHGHTYNYAPKEPDGYKMIDLLIAQNI